MVLGLAFSLVLTAILVLVMGLAHMRRSQEVVTECIAAIEESEVVVLANECMRVFGQTFGEPISLDDFDGATDALERVVNSSRAQTLKQAFATEEIYWRFVLVVGSFLGELLCRHAGARWVHEPGGLALTIVRGDATLTLHPFEKVLKHVLSGDAGDLRTYLRLAVDREHFPPDSMPQAA